MSHFDLIYLEELEEKVRNELVSIWVNIEALEYLSKDEKDSIFSDIENSKFKLIDLCKDMSKFFDVDNYFKYNETDFEIQLSYNHDFGYFAKIDIQDELIISTKDCNLNCEIIQSYFPENLKLVDMLYNREKYQIVRKIG